MAYILLLAGLAAKIGWAPVHNWLPDAHAEAPPPVSALLSAALLPAVLLVAWRSEQSLAPVVGPGTAQSVLIGFGLVSLAVAVPFLWRPLAWKRLLAYSSLEHMGVIALGIGFATPLALAGVAIHIVAHAIAKALGFYTAVPLLGHEPRAAGHSVTGIARTLPALGTSMGLSLGVLAGLPPFPLFASEVLIVAGGFQAGRTWAAAAATMLLALGFLGLAHALIETTVGKPHRRDPTQAPGLRGVATLTAISAVAAPRTERRRALAARQRRRRRARCKGSHDRPRSRLHRDRVAGALAEGWRFAGLHATAAERSSARCSRRQTARPVSKRRLRERGALPRSSTSRPPPTGTNARPQTCTAFTSPATSRSDRSSTTTSTSHAGRSACVATTRTKSLSGRSTQA